MFAACLTTFARPFYVAVLAVAAALLPSAAAKGHELWIETEPDAELGKAHPLHVCWGHAGDKATGPSLEAQHDKISTYVLRPDGSRKEVESKLDKDCFAANITPSEPGFYALGSELQTGIISRPLHSIPAGTRIIMYGKTLTHVAGSEEGLSGAVGFDLEIVPLTAFDELRPGRVARAKLLFQGEPLGGRGVEVTLSTAGPEPSPEHERIQSHEWSINAVPDPYTGEVAFPLIVSGRHTFTVRYFDETPGTYDGPRDDQSDFSHLRPGDNYEQTMYVSTLTIWVGEKSL